MLSVELRDFARSGAKESFAVSAGMSSPLVIQIVI
jgi:hypothetical protein